MSTTQFLIEVPYSECYDSQTGRWYEAEYPDWWFQLLDCYAPKAAGQASP